MSDRVLHISGTCTVCDLWYKNGETAVLPEHVEFDLPAKESTLTRVTAERDALQAKVDAVRERAGREIEEPWDEKSDTLARDVLAILTAPVDLESGE
jgi:hypothetical protein